MNFKHEWLGKLHGILSIEINMSQQWKCIDKFFCLKFEGTKTKYNFKRAIGFNSKKMSSKLCDFIHFNVNYIYITIFSWKQ
jgi:hypothetical protein